MSTSPPTTTIQRRRVASPAASEPLASKEGEEGGPLLQDHNRSDYVLDNSDQPIVTNNKDSLTLMDEIVLLGLKDQAVNKSLYKGA